MLVASVAAAADEQASGSESQVLLLKIEQQITSGHTVLPADNNALNTWQEFLRSATLGSPDTTRALQHFAQHVKDQAATELTAGKVGVAIYLYAFEEMANGLLTQGSGKPATEAARSVPAVPHAGAVATVFPTRNGEASSAAPGGHAAAPASADQNASQASAGQAASAELLKRGDALLAIKDISGARKFYEYAADEGNAAAAVALARTFDPEYLDGLGVVGLKPDPDQAAVWYRKAAQLGSQEARRRLQTIEAATSNIGGGAVTAGPGAAP